MCYYVRIEYTVCFSMKITMKRIIGIKYLLILVVWGIWAKKKNGFFEFLLLHWTYSKTNQKIALIT